MNIKGGVPQIMSKPSHAFEPIPKDSPLDGPPILSTGAIYRILGVKSPVPLTPEEMAKSLRVAFYPEARHTQKLDDFLRKLRNGLKDSGVQMVSYEEALAQGSNGRIGKGIVLIAVGEGQPGNLAIDHVASLSNNTVLGVLDGTMPGIGENRLQKRLNALVGALVWHMAHIIIYVDDTSWTICNMNGAIDSYSIDNLKDGILHLLIPKLAAPVVPPKKSDFEVHEDEFDISAPTNSMYLGDMLAGADLWGKTGLLTSQTRIDELAFRNSRYRRIAGAYLSWRTGMSYGFLARQLPVLIEPAFEFCDAPSLFRRLDWTDNDFYEMDNHTYVALRLKNKRFIVRIPVVSVLCTRSGCDKNRLNPSTDLLQLALIEGKVILGMPKGSEERDDCQPSFDTTTILAHAVGNAIVASLLKKLKPSSKFSHALSRKGLALAHWHGFLHPTELPLGYYSHGQTNPPVSCSTLQAAIYALSGKLNALNLSLEEGIEYLGDVHEEPSHGTNMTGRSLVKLAGLVAKAGM